MSPDVNDSPGDERLQQLPTSRPNVESTWCAPLWSMGYARPVATRRFNTTANTVAE
jgi:hypothetical protein